MEDGWWMKIFTIPFGSQVACCQTPTTHKSSWRDEGPQRLTIHSRRATYDLIWCEIWFDIFNYLYYLSTYSILILWINTIWGHSCYPSSLTNHPWGLGIPHQPAIWNGAMTVQRDSKQLTWQVDDWKLKRNHFVFACTVRNCVSAAWSPLSSQVLTTNSSPIATSCYHFYSFYSIILSSSC